MIHNVRIAGLLLLNASSLRGGLVGDKQS
ncbi:leu operon leader peptide [Pseudescherichia sp.]